MDIKKLSKIIFFILITLFLFFSIFNYYSKQGKEDLVSNNESLNSKICSRESEYEMEPEIERALSLLYQRIDEHKNDSTVQKDLIPTIDILLKIRNCLNIQFSEPNEISEEGYFIFDENSTMDNLQIYVNKKYSSYDDIVTALLLVHEVTHAVQFVGEKMAVSDYSCIEKEVEAVRMEYRLLRSLNYAENTSLLSRIEREIGIASKSPIFSNNERLDIAGLVGISQLLDIQNEILDICMKENESRRPENWINIYECAGEREEEYINQYIMDNSYYRQQCGL